VPVTLKDVAQLANVTPPVVSRVLHNKSSTVRVSAATAERVRNAAKQLGYRVNVMARNFRARQTNTIGVLNGQGLTRPVFARGPRYFAALMDGIVEGAFLYNRAVTLCPHLLGEHPAAGFADGLYDGLIWYSISPSQDVLDVLDQWSIPTVIIHGHAKEFSNIYPTVICDNDQGMGLAIDYLVELGHRRIAFAIEGDALNVESMERLAGFRTHMCRNGLHPLESDVIDVRVDRTQLHDYLAQGPRHTAVIVHGDGLASEMIQNAATHGVSIPDQLSVIGFDSTGFCDELRPSLTSISQPLFDIGFRATELLMRCISGEVPETLELVLPCGLDVRGSTTSAPQ